MATGPKRSDDFNTSELLAAQGEHGKNISELTERMRAVEGRLATPQQLATFLRESASDSRVLDAVFADMFCRFLAENKSVKEAMGKSLEEMDRNFFLKTFKRFGVLASSALLFIAGAVSKEVIALVMSWFQKH